MSSDANSSRYDVWTRPGTVPGPVHAPDTCRGYVERVFSPCEDTSAATEQETGPLSPGFPHWVLSFLTRS